MNEPPPTSPDEFSPPSAGPASQRPASGTGGPYSSIGTAPTLAAGAAAGPYSSPAAAGPYSSPATAQPYSSPATAQPYSSPATAQRPSATRAPLKTRKPRARTRLSFVALFAVVAVVGGGEILRERSAAPPAPLPRRAARASDPATRASTDDAMRALDDQIVRRRREAGAWFASLGPSDHLAAAEAALADGYNPRERVGGSLDEAEAHLAAIPADSPLAPRAARDRREIESRRARAELRALAASTDAARVARARAVTGDLAALQLANGCASLEAWRLTGPAGDAVELVCDRCSAPPPVHGRGPAGIAHVTCFDGTAP